MSQRMQRRDEAWVKDSATASNTGIRNDSGGGLSTGGWRRRSLFSSERLDLILSNLRHNLSKSVDSDRCKQISRDVSYNGDAHRYQQPQQQQRGAGKHIRISILLQVQSTTSVLITLQNSRDVALCRQLTSCQTTCDDRTCHATVHESIVT